MGKIIRLTENDLARIVRRVISEEMEQASGNNKWPEIYKGLSSFTDSSGNKPKIINFNYDGKKITSLNWGTHSDAGKKKNWGLSISSDKNEIIFQTKDEINAKIFKNVTGVEPEFNDLSKNWSSYEKKLDYSNPTSTISTVKKLINSLG